MLLSLAVGGVPGLPAAEGLLTPFSREDRTRPQKPEVSRPTGSADEGDALALTESADGRFGRIASELCVHWDVLVEGLPADAKLTGQRRTLLSRLYALP